MRRTYSARQPNTTSLILSPHNILGTNRVQIQTQGREKRRKMTFRCFSHEFLGAAIILGSSTETTECHLGLASAQYSIYRHHCTLPNPPVRFLLLHSPLRRFPS